MLKLLLSPEGTIDRQAFHRGAVILLALNFFMWLSWYVSLGLGALLAFSSFGLIYCWGCLFAKRLRGAGKSGLFFIPILAAFAILSYILSNNLTYLLSPETMETAMELQETVDPLKPDYAVVLPMYTEIFRGLAIPYAIGYFIVGVFLAFVVNKRLPDS